MASKTNCTINGRPYYRIRRKVGKKRNKQGQYIADYKFFYGKSKKEAEQKYNDYISRSILSQSACFGEAFERYTTDVFDIDASIKDSTKVNYKNSFYRVFDCSDIIGLTLSDINGQDIQKIINTSKSNASTLKQAVKMLRKFYRWLSDQNITNDITKSLVVPSVEHKRQNAVIETFTDDELQTFLYNIPTDNRIKLLIHIAINTGMRIGEILALRYDDFTNDSVTVTHTLQEIEPQRKGVSPTTFQISTPKTPQSLRTIPISQSLWQEVEQHRKWQCEEMKKNGYSTQFLFTTATGTHYYKRNLRRALQRLCNDLHIGFKSFHVFRHSFGSKLAKSGVPMQVVSALMGHSNITVTAKYYINIEQDNSSFIEK